MTKVKAVDKGKRVARYLTGRTGIPSLHATGWARSIDAPYPLTIRLTTDRATWRFFEAVKATDGQPTLGIVIRVDADNTLEASPVGMTLNTLAELLRVYYEAVIEPRERAGI